MWTFLRMLLFLVLWVLCLPLMPVFYLMCRLEAEQCPHCSESWYTELIGEWDGEQWRCMRCGKFWEITKNPPGTQ